jgi:hypothetical protein
LLWEKDIEVVLSLLKMPFLPAVPANLDFLIPPEIRVEIDKNFPGALRDDPSNSIRMIFIGYKTYRLVDGKLIQIPNRGEGHSCSPLCLSNFQSKCQKSFFKSHGVYGTEPLSL